MGWIDNVYRHTPYLFYLQPGQAVGMNTKGITPVGKNILIEGLNDIDETGWDTVQYILITSHASTVRLKKAQAPSPFLEKRLQMASLVWDFKWGKLEV